MIDMLIAGGGPAGLATALHATAAGLSVVVIEPRKAPIEKACCEGLMPPALRVLEYLGVKVSGQPFVGIRYVSGAQSVAARFTDGAGLGVARTELHARLHAAALDAGVAIRSGSVEQIELARDGVRAAGMHARYLVGADGLHSHVRELAGLDRHHSSYAKRWGLRAHYAIAPWTDHVEVHWSPIGEAYVTPLAPDLIGVAMLSGQRRSFDDQLQQLPDLARILGDAVPLGLRGAGPLRQDASRRVAGRVLLVGDAAGYVDALTGEGLAIAFRCAAALVQRVASDDVDAYEDDYERITAEYRRITSALLWLGSKPVLRRHLVGAASHVPLLFKTAVNRLARTSG